MRIFILIGLTLLLAAVPVAAQDSEPYTPDVIGAMTLVIEEVTERDDFVVGQAFLVVDPQNEASVYSICTTAHLFDSVELMNIWVNAHVAEMPLLANIPTARFVAYDELEDGIRCLQLTEAEALALPIELAPGVMIRIPVEEGTALMGFDWYTGEWSLLEVYKVEESYFEAEVVFGADVCKGQSGMPLLLAQVVEEGGRNRAEWLSVNGAVAVVAGVVTDIGVTDAGSSCGSLVRANYTVNTPEVVNEFVCALTGPNQYNDCIIPTEEN